MKWSSTIEGVARGVLERGEYMCYEGEEEEKWRLI
jgi:hypothetical protein